MEKEFPTKRVIASVIAVLLIVLGVYLIFVARGIAQEFRRQETLRPVDIQVDFSKPGKFVGKFHQIYKVVCAGGETRFFLEVPKGTFVDDSLPEVVEQLQFSCVVTGSPEERFWNYRSDEDEGSHSSLHVFSEEQLVELIAMSEYFRADSDYNLTIDVVQGAPELAGIPQRLFVATEVCGCEKLGIGACNLLMLACWSVAAIILSIVVVISIVKKRRKAKST